MAPHTRKNFYWLDDIDYYDYVFRAPSDCVQYYTGVEGYIASYGFGSGQLLYAQDYQACIRQEEGYCGIEWHPSSRTTPDSFGLLHTAATMTGQGENTIGTCVSSYINIPSATGYPNTIGGTQPDRYNNLCGEGWTQDGTTAALGPLRCKFDYLTSK